MFYNQVKEKLRGCPICGKRALNIFEKNLSRKHKSTWENESTMILLGMDSVDASLSFCLSCFHLFREPLFDESMIYGERGGAIRKEVFERYNTGQTYGGVVPFYDGEWFNKAKGVFSFFQFLLEFAGRSRIKNVNQTNINILDWGGGDGVLVEAIALISQKVLKIPCSAYCYDYHEWDKGSGSPYLRYLSHEDMGKEAPFDIIFLSHVLEHTSNPIDVLSQCRELITDNGVVVIAVPYEIYHGFSVKACHMHYHQQLFSSTSLRKSLITANFSDVRARYSFLSHRGNKKWDILAIGTNQKKNGKSVFLCRIRDVFMFFLIAISLIFRKVIHPIKAYFVRGRPMI